MANSTKKILSEQIRYRLEAGYPDVAASVQEEDVIKAIEQTVNALFKSEYLNVTLPSGETIPDNLMTAYYEGISVTVEGTRAVATLPVMPISLPRNMGVYRVTYGDNDTDFIPVPMGQGALLKADKLLNDLLGSIYYEVRKNKVVFSKDITLLGIDTVNMYLVVMDISQYSDTQVLPIPAGMEEQIIETVFAKFAPVGSETGVVNNFTTAGQKVNQ